MTDEAKRWFLFVVPGLGEVCAWVDPSQFAIGGVIDIECPTRILVDPRTGHGALVKMVDAGTIPLNLSAIPTWREAPAGLVADVSKTWDRIIVPERRLRIAHD